MASVDAVQSGTSQTQTSAVSGLSTDEFLKIVLQELQSQDPLEPNDTSAMLEQLSTIRSIQSDTDMMDRLERVVSQNALTSASGLVGTQVGGLNEFGDRVSGLVRAVSVTDEGPVLRLESGDRVWLDDVDEFRIAESDTDEAADDASGDGDDA